MGGDQFHAGLGVGDAGFAGGCFDVEGGRLALGRDQFHVCLGLDGAVFEGGGVGADGFGDGGVTTGRVAFGRLVPDGAGAELV